MTIFPTKYLHKIFCHFFLVMALTFVGACKKEVNNKQEISNEFLKHLASDESPQDFLIEQFPLGTFRENVEDTLINQVRTFSTLPFHMPKPGTYMDGPDDMGYIVIYYPPDKTKKNPAFHSGRTWEVRIYYNLQNKVTKIETNRIGPKVSNVPMMLLSKNPINSQRKKCAYMRMIGIYCQL